MTLALTPLLSLIAGILIWAVPRLLNYTVAIYLIVVGLVGLFGMAPCVSNRACSVGQSGAAGFSRASAIT